ncbi:hypothetical protein Droror1_Dr00000105 [Drosera rotundifolia]
MPIQILGHSGLLVNLNWANRFVGRAWFVSLTWAVRSELGRLVGRDYLSSGLGLCSGFGPLFCGVGPALTLVLTWPEFDLGLGCAVTMGFDFVLGLGCCLIPLGFDFVKRRKKATAAYFGCEQKA